jgi:phosphoglycolate phosphatase-like HAD superfamily hydrolase
MTSTAVRTITAVLFDWDGTLIDSRAALLAAWHESTERVLGRRFPATAAEERTAFTLPGSEIWPRLAATAEDRDALAEGFQEVYERSVGLVRSVPGIPAALAELREANVAVGVVTSKARRRYVLDARGAGLEELIDAAVCVEDAAATKPDPRPVTAALALLDVARENALMVGDTVVDVAAGIGAGTAVAGVAWGACTAAELREAGAGVVLSDPLELVDLVLRGEPRW